jgi:hypothetical protein
MADSIHLAVSNRDFQPSSSRILNSWKEISAYLGRGVRTVQRYEQKLALPVHRPAGRDRSAVLAFPDELERWVRSAPTRNGKLSVSTNGNSVLAVVSQFERVSDASELELAKQEMQRCYSAYVRARQHYYALKRETAAPRKSLQQ